jgi:hypothetical protein
MIKAIQMGKITMDTIINTMGMIINTITMGMIIIITMHMTIMDTTMYTINMGTTMSIRTKIVS